MAPERPPTPLPDGRPDWAQPGSKTVNGSRWLKRRRSFTAADVQKMIVEQDGQLIVRYDGALTVEQARQIKVLTPIARLNYLADLAKQQGHETVTFQIIPHD